MILRPKEQIQLLPLYIFLPNLRTVAILTDGRSSEEGWLTARARQGTGERFKANRGRQGGVVP